MHRSEADERLAADDVAPSAFSIGQERDEAYCMVSSEVGEFTVYSAERGHKREARTFAAESEALACLVECVLSDPTTRSGYGTAHLWHLELLD